MSVTSIERAGDLDRLIAEDAPTLVLFAAPLAGATRGLRQTLEALAAERNEWAVAIIDCDRLPDLAARYAIAATPTLLLFIRGELVASKLGDVERNVLLGWLEDHLADAAA